MALRPQRHTPSSTGWSGPTGSEESVTRRSSSSTAASGPSLIARNTPSRCHSSATWVGVAPSASSAFGSAPARSSARATEVRPSCAAYLRAVVVVVMIEEVAVAVAAAVVVVVVWEEEVASWWERRGSKGEVGK
eukprot:scaffold39729_cov63-Phaeocystis_antarctica.AAC.7